jgi:hypothetical protein
MELDPTLIIISLLLSGVGIGYYYYGKKRSPYFRLAGIILLIFPYFINELWQLLVIGLIIIVLPFMLERIIPL